jgi:hypothetical protein
MLAPIPASPIVRDPPGDETSVAIDNARADCKLFLQRKTRQNGPLENAPSGLPPKIPIALPGIIVDTARVTTNGGVLVSTDRSMPGSHAEDDSLAS